MTKKKGLIRHLVRVLLFSGGILFFLACLLAFTTLPFRAYYHLATSGSKINSKPDVIVMLAGAGIPSENSLIRAYYTAHIALEYPEALVIVAAPGRKGDTLGDPVRISGELVLRGVSPGAIRLAMDGKNTRGQAMETARMIPASTHDSLQLVVVTSPEHIKRAVLAFKKCGFKHVGGLPAFESSLQMDLTFEDKDLKGNPLAPPIGESLQVRYQFWNHLKYEILIAREYFALIYYKFRGWI